MGALADLLDKLQFWRDDSPAVAGAPDADDGIDACFTLPGAELDDHAPVVDSSADEGCR